MVSGSTSSTTSAAPQPLYGTQDGTAPPLFTFIFFGDGDLRKIRGNVDPFWKPIHIPPKFFFPILFFLGTIHGALALPDLSRTQQLTQQLRQEFVGV